MRRLLRSRRGTVAFAAVIAAIPLIGVVGLGAEAGSWYVTKQHAQNAADAAAYAGALRLACKLGEPAARPAPIPNPMTIAASNSRHRTLSAMQATRPIPEPVASLRRQEPRRR